MDRVLIAIGLLLLGVTVIDLVSTYLLPHLRRRREKRRDDGIDGGRGGSDDGYIGSRDDCGHGGDGGGDGGD